MNFYHLLPKDTLHYPGPKPGYYFLVLVTVLTTARSLIHMFLADGGAHSIAGIVFRVDNSQNIIAIFGQWGASQLMLSLLYWITVLYYRGLVSLMLSLFVVEQILRIFVGQLKPMDLAAPPPGAYGSYLMLALALIFLAISLKKK